MAEEYYYALVCEECGELACFSSEGTAHGGKAVHKKLNPGHKLHVESRKHEDEPNKDEE